MKPPLRTKSVGTKVSEAEFALLEERARGAGMRLAEWVREALLPAPVESGPDSGEVAVGEILALRSLLLNLHFRAAKGEAIPEPEMRGLIERADGSKIERARERLDAARAASLDTVRAAQPLGVIPHSAGRVREKEAPLVYVRSFFSFFYKNQESENNTRNTHALAKPQSICGDMLRVSPGWTTRRAPAAH